MKWLWVNGERYCEKGTVSTAALTSHETNTGAVFVCFPVHILVVLRPNPGYGCFLFVLSRVSVHDMRAL